MMMMKYENVSDDDDVGHSDDDDDDDDDDKVFIFAEIRMELQNAAVVATAHLSFNSTNRSTPGW